MGEGGARVEAGWQKVRDDGRVCPLLLEAAYGEPCLRHLFPWTGCLAVAGHDVVDAPGPETAPGVHPRGSPGHLGPGRSEDRRTAGAESSR
ncbi:DUF6193 family natural product biosynthesis protein [Streptomyces varsoviensis]|uniref:DUF6193 family natural product biosynthesis protein n=1 Tax=Streptomyces varsoviensis TaxID=67373 RepID=UPI000AE2EB83